MIREMLLPIEVATMVYAPLRERFHGELELERIQGKRVGKMKMKRPYSRAYT
jgi:hypothetical protein